LSVKDQQLRGASQSRKKRLLQANYIYHRHQQQGNDGLFPCTNQLTGRHQRKERNIYITDADPQHSLFSPIVKATTMSSQFLFPAKNNRKIFPILVSISPLTHQ
jgi:hypothetical protein